MSDRYHRAARDGYLDLLKEATRKDCNNRDDDGMTPTLWAAFEGNLDALRLIIGRGGDPEKCDNYGNTALHFAAARGHMTCVTFLVNYGVNLWAKDIDFHTPTDLAAMNDRQDILRFLDDVAAKEERKNSKKVKSLKEKAQKDAEKRVKEFGQVQEKARKLAEKEKKRLDKERQRMETSVADSNGDMTTTSATVGNPILRPSMAALGLRRDSRLVYANQSQKFSDLVGTTRDHRETRPKLPGGAVFKKVQQQQIKKMLGSKKSPGDTLSKSSTTLNEVPGEDDFKVGAIEDGKRSVRSITGLRRDSEVMYVPRFESNPTGKRNGLEGVFDDDIDGKSTMPRSKSESDFTNPGDSGFGDDVPYMAPRASIFERPGFGSVAFRNSITAQLSALPKSDSDRQSGPTNSDGGISIGSAGSLAQRNHKSAWDNDDLDSDESDDSDGGDTTPLHFFLAASGLSDFADLLVREKIDLDSLILLTEADLKNLGMPLGPRRKLLQAIAERKSALEDPGEMEDSHL